MRWKITWDRFGKFIEFMAWFLIFVAGLHVAEFIIASFYVIWTLFLIHKPELADRIYILFLWQILWIILLVGGLVLSRFKKKKKQELSVGENEIKIKIL